MFCDILNKDMEHLRRLALFICIDNGAIFDLREDCCWDICAALQKKKQKQPLHRTCAASIYNTPRVRA